MFQYRFEVDYTNFIVKIRNLIECIRQSIVRFKTDFHIIEYLVR